MCVCGLVDLVHICFQDIDKINVDFTVIWMTDANLQCQNKPTDNHTRRKKEERMKCEEQREEIKFESND